MVTKLVVSGCKKLIFHKQAHGMLVTKLVVSGLQEINFSHTGTWNVFKTFI